MEQYIKKSDIVAEIKSLMCTTFTNFDEGVNAAAKILLENIDALEVKDVDTWHLQEKENIYDAVKDWSLQTFACIMKDGTIQKFTGNLDEDYDGHINVHIYGANDDYDNVDDIVKWIEFT